jgi:hypothetical protein
LANPFTAAINIADISYTNCEQNVYLYNAGSLLEWTNAGSGNSNGESPGQYTVANGNYAGLLGALEQIPSMQGFLINATSGGASVTLPNSVKSNTIAQRSKSFDAANTVGTRIDVVGSSFSDKMWIFTEPTATRTFDNGFDGPKLLGSALTPQLYAMEEDGNYQIDAIKDLNNTYLGFQAGSETNLKLVFTHQNLSANYGSVYLVDLVANKTVDITTSGTEYAFTAETSATPVTKRFKIITQTTGVNTPNAGIDLKLYSSEKTVVIDNKNGQEGNLVIYNLSGSAIQTVKFDAKGLITIPITVGKGVYVAKAKTATEEVTEKLIIR